MPRSLPLYWYRRISSDLNSARRMPTFVKLLSEGGRTYFMPEIRSRFKQKKTNFPFKSNSLLNIRNNIRYFLWIPNIIGQLMVRTIASQQEGSCVWIPAGAFLCGICMFPVYARVLTGNSVIRILNTTDIKYNRSQMSSTPDKSFFPSPSQVSSLRWLKKIITYITF